MNLLKLPFTNDSNTLDKGFYSELLHIIGLVETKEGGKKLIQRQKEHDRNIGSLIENAISQVDSLDKISRLEKPELFGENYEEQLFNLGLELAITWMNRILFLKLLEAQLIRYHKNDPSWGFLNLQKVTNYDDLNSLFFSVLARKPQERSQNLQKKLQERFAHVPYLNSSLFEPTDIEQETICISNLRNEKLPIFTGTILKDNNGKKLTGEINTLEYLFAFLNAYNFSSDTGEEIQEENKRLINASVLGLIFEKINGYKDGSFFTPGFITMYMCRETIRRAVIQKFNDVKGWNCETIDDLYDKIEDKKAANDIINGLKICDPAVGSGHFLVSALNEIIAIKSELKILLDRQGKRLKEYSFEVANDELVVTDEDGLLFEYNPKNQESQRVQETLFHEKQTIIESCLFGVDINPNSVKICRLRLWIELLKNAYYKTDSNYTELETLPNIDINIKCGNSLISRFGVDTDLKTILISKKSQSDIEKYKGAVRNYFNAKSREDKKIAEQEVIKIKKNFNDSLKEIGYKPKKTKLDKLEAELNSLENQQELELFEKTKKDEKEKEIKIIQLKNEIHKLKIEIAEIETGKIYNNAFEWRFEFPEVLNDQGAFIGFDVIIGNPPYISIQDLNKTDKNVVDYYRNNFKSAKQGTFDIYILFLERINSLTSSCSNSSFIIPSKFLTTDYGKLIRQYLLENKLIYEIIDFEDHQVFDTATTYTCIVFINKFEKSSLSFCRTQPSKVLNQEYVKNNISYSDLLGKTWVFDSNTSIKLVEKIKNNSAQLKDLPCDICRGSSTGNDNIFTLTQENEGFINGYGEYIELENDILIKPIYATHFSRYLFRNNINTYLIFPYFTNTEKYHLLDEDTFKQEYPKTYQYLLNHKTKLEERKQIKKWYAYSAARSLNNHNKSDILIPLLADKGIFTLTPQDGKYTLMAGGGFSISIKNQSIDKRFLLSLLNSKMLFFVLYRESNKFRGGYITCTKQYFENLPIKIVSSTLQKPFIQLVNQILNAKKSDPNADTTALEAEIDQMVYQLYNLTAEEIEIIESSSG
ncbi:type IIG restriction enzyme/methyltransferase [Cuspidothrix issatschenkoi]|uniref:site-specific DNA-methyltransferase (adenine-specific) n=1 Tax=Cuspidothrix issatschenkoi CHARLIE-1 TaxID=2052836 RepID=A0A2S6CUX3_9CYAN|nr:Eco57I restriction-modification methylase domain-containing protein [Cuspidothrix issatschenkoi]PPJ63491.1 type II restriction endonuclease [Cuspidothrix issatschenkoi CHARLIE-1]